MALFQFDGAREVAYCWFNLNGYQGTEFFYEYIKSDFDLFWDPDILLCSDFDVINQSPNDIRILLNNFSK